MTLAPQQNADDSCLINQTVPAAALVQPPEQLDGKSQLNPNPQTSPNTGEEHANQMEHSHPVANLPAQLSYETDDDEEDADFPEGGLRAWLVVFGSFCSMVSVYGIINVAAVFESYFTTNQLRGYSSSSIGWIFSVYLFIVFFFGIQVGPIFDRYGPRYLIAIGSVMCVASQMLLGLCEGEFIVFFLSLFSCAGARLIPKLRILPNSPNVLRARRSRRRPYQRASLRRYRALFQEAARPCNRHCGNLRLCRRCRLPAVPTGRDSEARVRLGDAAHRIYAALPSVDS